MRYFLITFKVINFLWPYKRKNPTFLFILLFEKHTNFLALHEYFKVWISSRRWNHSLAWKEVWSHPLDSWAGSPEAYFHEGLKILEGLDSALGKREPGIRSLQLHTFSFLSEEAIVCQVCCSDLIPRWAGHPILFPK